MAFSEDAKDLPLCDDCLAELAPEQIYFCCGFERCKDCHFTHLAEQAELLDKEQS